MDLLVAGLHREIGGRIGAARDGCGLWVFDSMNAQDTVNQVAGGASQVSYWIGVVILPALAAAIPWIKSKASQFVDDIHAIRVMMETELDKARGKQNQ